MNQIGHASSIFHYLAEDTLRDGRRFKIRALLPEDMHVLQDVLHHLSTESRYFRFMTPKNDYSPKELNDLTKVDPAHHVALLAFIDDGAETPLGIGEFFVSGEEQRSRSAEVAFSVEEDYQGQGVATALLRHLTGIALAAGIVEFTALVHPENHKMLEVFANSELSMTEEITSNTVEITLKLGEQQESSSCR